MNSLLSAAFLCSTFFIGTRQAVAQENTTVPVVVLYNTQVVESKELAAYYAQRRNIPIEQVIGLDLPDDEVITRKQYNERLRIPLLNILKERNLLQFKKFTNPLKKNVSNENNIASASFKYLVSMYGMPLKIKDTKPKIQHAIINRTIGGAHLKANMASVESELTLLLIGDYDLAGLQKNPYYQQFFLPHPGSGQNLLLATARLDAPVPGLVKRMIDHAIASERYGILGRVYIDTQGLSKGTYIQGDSWLTDAGAKLSQEGYETIINNHPGIFTDSFPIEDVGFYLGWYAWDFSGGIARKDVKFRTGSIAYHLHSFSASSLKTSTEHWVGPFLSRGVTVTMGSVYEPYLSNTINVSTFTDRVLRGYPLGDAFFFANSVLSWQMTLLGDPLYAPFKNRLEIQIKNLEQDDKPEVEWAYLRVVNKLVKQGRFNIALNYCREKISETDSIILNEKLGDLYALNSLLEESLQIYRLIISKDLSEATAVRVGGKIIYVLELLKREEEVEAFKASLLNAIPKENVLKEWIIDNF